MIPVEKQGSDFTVVTSDARRFVDADGQQATLAMLRNTPDLAPAFGVFFVDVADPDGRPWTGAFIEAAGVPAPVFGDVPPPTPADIAAERERRLQAGFDFDFADARGTHRIGTTAEDMRGWDEVTKGAAAFVALGGGATEFTILTDTGPVVVTALEWQAVLAEATAVRQPIYAASFALQAMEPIPADFADDRWWPQ